MIEYHGWLRARACSFSRSSDFLRFCAEATRRVSSITQGLGFGKFQQSSELGCLFVTGQRNHHGPEIEEVKALWRYAAEAAPAACGLLFLWDDEDEVHDNELRVWVLQDGELIEKGDPILSPMDRALGD